MEKARELTKKLKDWGIPISLGGIIFLSLAHHTINVWELAALKLILLFLILVPVCAAAIYWLGNKTRPHIHRFSKTQLILYCLVALSIGSFIAWRIHHIPASYQTITIAPSVAENETVGLLELKANGNVIPLYQAALQNQWQERDGVLYAAQNSRPIAVSFKSTAGAPITLLFLTSPQSGAARISFGHEVIEADLHSTDTGNSVVGFTARYRGIANEIFIPLLALLDILTVGILILFLLVLQELGQVHTTPFIGRTEPRRADLGLLLVTGFVLHLLNLLSVPLILDADSPAFLQGAVHLLKYGNLDGVSRVVGPGSTFLFAPVMFLFGRNPWGIKILLHLIALACIPVCYRLGWQVSRNRAVAFLSGLIVILEPDVYFYANYVMSDILNILLVLLFCSLLLSALETLRPGWIFASLLTSSFAILLRSENILVLMIGALALAAEYLWRWLQDRSLDLRKSFLHLGLAFVIAALPVLWWSGHNQRLHGFFGMSNYLGVVLYDGWVYYGDASRLAFSDPSSPAIQTLKQVTERYPITITDKSGFATGWETYPALIKAGYTTEQAMSLLKSAALDSIQKNRESALRLLFIKLRAGLRPEITHNITYSLPGEPAWTTETKLKFFDAENVPIPFLIRLQQKVNEQVGAGYPHVYPVWVLFCVLALALSVFRRPMIHWVAWAAIVATRIFIPLTLSVPFWRYTLSGWIPLQIMAISWILILVNGTHYLLGDRPSPGETALRG